MHSGAVLAPEFRSTRNFFPAQARVLQFLRAVGGPDSDRDEGRDSDSHKNVGPRPPESESSLKD
jgi:hypothetical protein